MKKLKLIIGGISILFLLSFATTLVLWNKNKSLNESIQLKNGLLDYNSETLNEYAKAYPFIIEEIQIANVIGDSNCGYDAELISSKIRYITPRIICKSYKKSEDKLKIYYKIYTPQRKLKYNPEYSTEYSGDANNFQPSGGGDTIALLGWGNNKTSVYPKGRYSIEIWCNDKCFGIRNFIIR
ncbi:MAG: hypothetical protein BGN96_11250 [Bacteroidales bacterium 45-6]|mgnify:CR=1 FL=1|uniref:hypothetical protein n=1 Tax=uncultured Dysgonomonas sp. TaxID=206096 RepID=UPI000967670A|nr:hypothetical protein [uncultured Dysgonomonas sp.]OJU49085.1 MAG: hypothetical protein BGN96_11250 [Bacteroidales bacterium 45-6]